MIVVSKVFKFCDSTVLSVLVRGNGDTYGGVIDPMGSTMRTKEAAKDMFEALWRESAFRKNALIGFGLTTYTLLGLGVLGGPLSLPWGLYVLICQRAPEKPSLNDVTEVRTWRRTVLTVAILLVVLTLLPVGDELVEELGIGLVTTF
ncbi:hypothetical protein ACSBR1_021010 [Camellia fascicularis]